MSVLYNMYNMNSVYNLSQFRASLRTAFNDAEAGKEVLVERYGKVYKLVATKHSIEIPAENLPRDDGLDYLRKAKAEKEGREPSSDQVAPRSGLESLGPEKIEPLFRNKKKGKI